MFDPFYALDKINAKTFLGMFGLICVHLVGYAFYPEPKKGQNHSATTLFDGAIPNIQIVSVHSFRFILRFGARGAINSTMEGLGEPLRDLKIN